MGSRKELATHRQIMMIKLVVLPQQGISWFWYNMWKKLQRGVSGRYRGFVLKNIGKGHNAQEYNPGMEENEMAKVICQKEVWKRIEKMKDGGRQPDEGFLYLYCTCTCRRRKQQRERWTMQGMRWKLSCTSWMSRVGSNYMRRKVPQQIIT